MTVRGAAATSSSNAFIVQNSAGSPGLSITNGLTTVVHGDLQLENTVVYWNGGSQIRNISDGVLRITNSSNSDFTRLQFGGGTTSFPSLQRSGSALCVMDASGTSLSNLLVGTTTDAGYKLDVNGTARVTALRAGDFYALGAFSVGISGGGAIGTFQYGAVAGGAYLQFIRAGFAAGGISLSRYEDYDVVIGAGNYGSTLGIAIRPAQIGGVKIGGDNATVVHVDSAILNVESTTKGVLFPRMTTVQKVAISTPATGLTVYDTTLNTNEYYDGAAWRSIASQAWVQSQGYITGYTEGDTLQIVSDRGRVTTSLSSTGTTLVASATTGYTGVFFNYTLGDGTNYRAGTVTSVVSSGSTVEFTETSTNDIGNTSPVSLSVGVSSGNINLSATTTTTGWTIKVVPQGI
jgi:hypothetical protein